ncbi:MAG: hypothetical protein PHR35_10640 [Kiritimatiellae bacterium]|nr:hypothetical protein [Kiritimatiellia bacterium]
MTTTNTVSRRFLSAALPLVSALALALSSVGCATPGRPHAETVVPRSARASLRERWGIEIASLHMSAHGNMVDFRYRVLDPDKAALLGDRAVKPAMTDLATGSVLRVPSFPKTGSMRQTAAKMEANRIYFMLFANTGRVVKSGSRVTVTVGDFKAENLTVQ